MPRTLGRTSERMDESYPYRAELAQYANALRARLRKQLWRDDSLSKAERMHFVGFLFVRKLIEYRKVTDACAKSTATILRSPIMRAREVSDFARHDLEKDLASCRWTRTKIDVHQLADKFIHAWWIIPVQAHRGGLWGHALTTDRKRNSELWLVSTQTVISVFQRFSREVITSLHSGRDHNGRLTYWKAT